ncbi:MAG: 50S ribosomal protein L24 [Candidatus Paceibacterota bacterium]|jgi:large subunit ribosomal protein L24
MKIKKNDNVVIITGKDRGKQGKVLRVLAEDEKVLVEGMNLRKKHQKPRKEGDKGQMIDMPHPIHISNVALYCSSCGKGVRMGAKMADGKKKVRVCKKCGKEI